MLHKRCLKLTLNDYDNGYESLLNENETTKM